MRGNGEKTKNTKEKSFPSFIILKHRFKPSSRLPFSPPNPNFSQFSTLKKRKFGNTVCVSQSTNHGLYLTQSFIKLGKKKRKNNQQVGLYKEDKRRRNRKKKNCTASFLSSLAIFLH